MTMPTPVPYYYDKANNCLRCQADDCIIAEMRDGAFIGEANTKYIVDEEMEANAELIVRAVNSRSELAEALKEAMECIRIFHGPQAWEIYERSSPEMQRFKTALKNAGE